MKKWFAAILLLLGCSPAWASISLVQTATPVTITTAAATLPITLAGVAVGDTLIVAAHIPYTQTFTSVADSSGDSVQTAVNAVDGTNSWRTAIFYVSVLTAGTHTITITMGGNVTATLFMAEYSGLATTSVLDQASTVAGQTGLTTVTTNSVTTTANGDLAVFLAGQDSAGNATRSAYTNGFVEQQSSSTGEIAYWGSAIQSAAGSLTAGWTLSPARSVSDALVTFKAASGAASAHPPLFVIQPSG